jgi:Oxidoreductase family, C-terminal alpha/beta domain/Oxidoreductase family, NAD-binding Rossmann fold/TAT (twin-arginine translocation) pathway signal sequence
MNKQSFSRRDFLKSAAIAGATFALPALIPSTVLGRNAPGNRINVALIGMGLMMSSHHHIMLGRGDVQVLAVCDVDRTKRERAKALTERAYSAKMASGAYKGCDDYNEFERIIERRDIDAVIVATPDHWHTMVSLAAMKSGKDVYVQKPMTLTVREGRLMSNTSREYGAILQVGSQQRSERAFRKACEIVRNGWIGKVHTIYTDLGEFPPPQTLPGEPIPDGFDYDRWLGPTPWYPYNKKRVEGNYGGGWRCFWDYGERKNGDWGAHHFDIIQWALGMDDSGPVEFFPKGFEGARYQSYVYADGTKVWKNHPVKNGQMIQFIGEAGEVLVSRGDRLETTPAGLRDRPLVPGDIHLYESYNHEGNWLECIRSRKPNICTAEIGHRTATVCHLNGIAERLNRPIKWDPAREEIVGDACASQWLDRPRRTPYVI